MMTNEERELVKKYIIEDLLTDPVLGMTGTNTPEMTAAYIIKYADNSNWAYMYGLVQDLSKTGWAIYNHHVEFIQMVQVAFEKATESNND